MDPRLEHKLLAAVEELTAGGSSIVSFSES